MSINHPNIPGDQIEDGSYFKQARNWYSDIYHRPIAERSYYIIIIVLSVVNVFFAAESFFGVFPIKPIVPFVLYSDNATEDLPHIQSIITDHREDKNVAVMKFMLRNYVTNRESYEYDPKLYETRYRNVVVHSAAEVARQYQDEVNPASPRSPYRIYTTAQKRLAHVTGVTYSRSPELSRARVLFTTDVLSSADNKLQRSSKWQADIDYSYTDFQVDQEVHTDSWLAHLFGLTKADAKDSGERRKIVPMKFQVTSYQVKELLE